MRQRDGGSIPFAFMKPLKAKVRGRSPEIRAVCGKLSPEKCREGLAKIQKTGILGSLRSARDTRKLVVDSSRALHPAL